MPELPEVEVVGRNLRRWAVGHRIAGVTPLREATFQDGSLETALQVVGHQLTDLERRGKALWLETDGPVGWLVRFGMTGKWVRGEGLEPPPYTRVTLTLEDGTPLYFIDRRNLGGIWGLPSEVGRATLQAWVTGIDPILDGLEGADLERLFYQREAPVKALLLDQALVCGVGNIYASEALFRAGIHPLTPAGRLEPGARDRLARAIVEVLNWAIDAEWRDEVKYFGEHGVVNIFSVYQREGEPCPRCGQSIARVVVGGRASFFCPRCQPPLVG